MTPEQIEQIKEASRVQREKCQVQHCQGCKSEHCRETKS